MHKINRPDNLSNGAWHILETFCNQYNENESKYLEIPNAFDYTRSELETYMQELHDSGYVMWQNCGASNEYLYLTFKGYCIARNDNPDRYIK
ncbi:hypothetical protein HMPREF9630_00239 [Peptoanaerobacter stomatis]|uniref:Uncharacterized protein n=1 Tax=Peptoanaerobacter stomatis TaxID=796937 RepID=V9HV86_9FIRM|nr:hypothetical protein [Peptoanaerobacter stomatis]EHL18514.1 hypothetical protein HMPREF9630_00239 [Peptoanaerobacter stomatis]